MTSNSLLLGLGLLPTFPACSLLPTFTTGVIPSVATPTTPTTGAGLPTVETEHHSWPLPTKLIKRILDLEYIDMVDLIPDSWRLQEEEPSKCCHQSKRQRRGPVTDILLWVECYATMVEVLATKYPSKMPGLMSYQRTIVRAHRTFQGDSWATYDTCYRRKAAARKSLDWGAVDFTLYNETFAGRAKVVVRCKFCSSEHHTSAECVYAPPEQSVRPPPQRQRYDSSRAANHTCLLFNHQLGNRCRFNPCRFSHSCSECHGSHPASQCRSRQPPSKTSRTDSPPRRGRR